VGREAIAVDAVRRGFALGNHSYLHPDFSHIGLQEARSEIERTEALIEDVYARAGVQRPGKWFRFPFLSEGGDRRAALQAMLRELGFAQPDAVARRLDEQERARIDWPTTVGTHDWELPPENVFRMLVASTCPGDVVEFHDWPDTVARYGQRLVEGLSKLSLRATVPGALTPAATSANMAPEVWVTTQPGRRRR
jgi:peptidoglycan/xylan/chitin deacetylase (PgdA/CDA1 family)